MTDTDTLTSNGMSDSLHFLLNIIWVWWTEGILAHPTTTLWRQIYLPVLLHALERAYLTFSGGLFLFMCLFNIFGVLILTFYFRKAKESKSSGMGSQAPGVSLLRPLKGVDNNISSNLESSFLLVYPKFEIIFTVADRDDPVVEVAQGLMRKYPKVNATLLIGDKEPKVGVNPKINNLMIGYKAAKYDILWILDSNVYTVPGALGRAVDPFFDPAVGLVHMLPCGTEPKSLGSFIELSFLNCTHAKMYFGINMVGLASCVVGKSNLMRKSVLEKTGGLSEYGRFMSEDNIIGTAIMKIGYKHRLSSDMAYQPLGSVSLNGLFSRRARWTRIRKYILPGPTLFEPFTESIMCGLVSSYFMQSVFGIHPLTFLPIHFMIWFISDAVLVTTLYPEVRKDFTSFVLAWFIRETTALIAYMHAILGNKVEWRGKLYTLHRDGTVSYLREASPRTRQSSVCA